MKKAHAIAVGMIVGLLVAGVVAPAVILALPPRLRGAGVVWSIAAVLAVAGASLFRFVAGRAGRR